MLARLPGWTPRSPTMWSAPWRPTASRRGARSLAARHGPSEPLPVSTQTLEFFGTIGSAGCSFSGCSGRRIEPGSLRSRRTAARVVGGVWTLSPLATVVTGLSGGGTLAWDGSAYVVAWATGGTLFLRRLGEDGTLLGPAVSSVATGPDSEVVWLDASAGDGTLRVALLDDRASQFLYHVYFLRLAGDGTTIVSAVDLTPSASSAGIGGFARASRPGTTSCCGSTTSPRRSRLCSRLPSTTSVSNRCRHSRSFRAPMASTRRDRASPSAVQRRISVSGTAWSSRRSGPRGAARWRRAGIHAARRRRGRGFSSACDDDLRGARCARGRRSRDGRRGDLRPAAAWRRPSVPACGAWRGVQFQYALAAQGATLGIFWASSTALRFTVVTP